MFINEAKAIELLLNGEVVAIPTETVFGIFALYSNNNAVEKLLNLKKRQEKHLGIYINKEFDQYKLLSSQLSNDLKKYLPGPLTIVKNCNGYRISSNKILQNIIDKIGPLSGTSANLTGFPPITEAKFLNFNIPAINEDCQLGIESTVLDLDNDKIIRNGYIDMSSQYKSTINIINPYKLDKKVKIFYNSKDENLFQIGLDSKCDFKLNSDFNNFWSSLHYGIQSGKNINFSMNLDINNYLENLIYYYIQRLTIS